MNDSREEDAFRSAFARAAGAFEPTDLQLDPPGRSAPARGGRGNLLAAAAAVLVVLAATSWFATHEERAARPAPAADATDAAPLTPSATRSPRKPRPSETTAKRPRGGPSRASVDRRSGSTSASSVPGGWRLESFADLQVAVPAEWGYGEVPGSDWCAGGRRPSGPFVAFDSAGGPTMAIGCGGGVKESEISPEGVPKRLWVPYVALDAAPAADSGAQPDGTYQQDGWTKVVRTVGDARLTVLHDRGTAAQAARVLESARRLERADRHGCLLDSDIQTTEQAFERPARGFDVAALRRVDDIAVCQYLTAARPDRVGLQTSRLIEGAAAQQLLEAIQAAPKGGGPDAPRNCGPEVGEHAIVLRLRAGDSVREMYVHYETCVGNGFDDGLTRRRLTKASCAPLWGAGVKHRSGIGKAFDACYRDR